MSPQGSSIRRWAGAIAGVVLLGALVAPSPAQAAAGDISTAAGSLGTGTATSIGMSARGLAVTGTTLYVADQDAHVVRKVNLSNGATTIAGGIGVAATSGDGGQATAAAFNRPTDVAVDSSGNIYIAAWYDNKVRKITVGTGVITTVAGTGAQGFTELTKTLSVVAGALDGEPLSPGLSSANVMLAAAGPNRFEHRFDSWYPALAAQAKVATNTLMYRGGTASAFVTRMQQAADAVRADPAIPKFTR